MTDRTTVAIVFGGVSSEHDVSCLTAAGVTRAIDLNRFDVIGVGITPSGRWVQVALEEMQQFDIVDNRLPRLSEDRPDAVLLQRDSGAAIASRVGDQLVGIRPFDVAFCLLHGPFGEDGTVQGLFEMLGVRYVGSGVAASAICMDKDLMKRSLKAAGLPVGRYVPIPARGWQRDPQAVREAVAELGFPVFVKPARGGSSLGISRVTSMEDFDQALAEAQHYDPKTLVEQGFLNVREIEIAVLDSLTDRPRVTLAGEIQVHTPDAFYDFEAKYLSGSQVTLSAPADLSGELLEKCQDVARRAFEALDCEGLARVDLFVSSDGDVVVNEINTMPGFTRISMFPALWAASGIGYRDLITELIDLALNRPLGLR